MSKFLEMAIAAYATVTTPRSKDERGATAVEYGLMVALIAVVIIAAVTLVGGELTSIFTDVSDALTGAGGA